MTQTGRLARWGSWRSWALLVVAAAAWWPAAALGEIRVVIDGQALGFSGAAPARIGGRVMVPMRGIFEALDAAVQWEASTRGITAQRGDTTVRMHIGNSEAQINDGRVRLDQPPVLHGGSTMVPLRFVGEALGAQVGWDDAGQTVSIASAGAGPSYRSPSPTGTSATLTQAASRLVVLPPGSVVPVRLDQSLSSKTANVGDRFTTTVRFGSDDAGLPEGTHLEGVVREAVRSASGKPGALDLAFQRMVTPGGQIRTFAGSLIALDAKSVERSESGRMVATASKSKDRLVFIGIGAGAGLITAVLTKGNKLTYSVLGAAAGYLYNEFGKKPKAGDVSLKPGTEFGVRIDSELAFQTNQPALPALQPDTEQAPAQGYRPPPSTVTGVTGTVESVDPPTAVTLRLAAGADGSAGQVSTYRLAQNAILYRSTALAPEAGTTPVFRPALPLSLADLAPGEEVRLSLSGANQVVRFDSQAFLAAVKVRSADGKRIVLDDWQGTALSIGPQMRYISRGGTPSTGVDVRRGETVVLFLSPTQRTIYQVSASDAHLRAAASGGATPPNQPPTGVVRIDTVEHDATQPLREGEVLTVTVRGASGAVGTYDLSPTAQGLPLAEDRQRSGTYTGTYRVRARDDVLRRRVTAHLVSDGLQEAIAQSASSVTLDTVRPRIVGTFPANGSAFDVAQQNLTVYADDIGGSGIASGTMEITNKGKNWRVNALLTPPTAVGAVPPEALSGPVSVKATVADAAGNVASTTFAFTVGVPAGAITAMMHTALQPVVPGAAFTVEMWATPGGQAALNLVDDQDREVTQDVALPEVAAGRYRADVALQAGQTGERLRVLGKFTGANGRQSTAVAAAPVTRAEQAVAAPVLAAPGANEQVTSPLVVRGKAAPNAVVEVAVRAEGTQVLLVIITQPYREDLDTQQIQADARGNWATQPIALPRPRDTRGLKYTITVTQTNVAGQRSDPATVVVTPK